MALSKLIVSSLLVSFILLHLVLADQPKSQLVPAQAEVSSLQVQQIDCNGECGRRCRLASRQRLCHRACGTCCSRCNCVPPGTSGNQEVCPCYANQITHGGRRKCP